MRTTFRERQPFADIFLECAGNAKCRSPVKPERFMRVMRQNKGSIAFLSGNGLDKEGLERKNPVIAALGDSVTAGHFEGIISCDPLRWFKKAAEIVGRNPEELDPEVLADPEKAYDLIMELSSELPEGQSLPRVEITDTRESYVEKFRQKLIDLYEETSVSAINAGIAGDNLIMMEKRLYRDVIRYQPDLVLINGSLNWNEDMGSTAFYKDLLIRTVKRVQDETDADIILLTPNGIVDNERNCLLLEERVDAIREAAGLRAVCLSDTYAVWEEARRAGCPWEELLANRNNHPGVLGHEVYALTLMKLFVQ